MLNKQGFDLWANAYDETVKVSEESNLGSLSNDVGEEL